MRKTTLLPLLLALLLLATRLAAGDDAATDRGFKAGAQYDFHDVDAINQFNGNLTARIPLGQRYTTNGTLAYQFTLSYNSNLWDWIIYDGGPSGFNHVREMTYTNQYSREDDAPSAMDGRESFPARRAHAGIGWTASLGELQETVANLRYSYEYVSEDGAGHPFYDSLHGTASLPAPTTAGLLYTRDSSYIRMIAVQRDAQNNVLLYEVQLPNGIHKRYRRVDWKYDKQLPRRWLLESITDPFGNILWVERSPALPPGANQSNGTVPAGGASWIWTYKEGTTSSDHYVDYPSEVAPNLVRTHTLTYRVQKFYDVRLEQMDLASSAGSGTFTFHYDDTSLWRSYGSTWADAASIYVPFTNEEVSPTAGPRIAVSLLRSITLPANGGQWSFDYITDPRDLLPISWPADSQATITYNTSLRGGHLARLNFPTGGGISYDYGNGGVPRVACGQRGSGFPSLGVVKRTTWKDATTVDGTWLYARTGPTVSFSTATVPCRLPKEWMAAVVDPFGKTDLAYYSIYAYDGYNPENWSADDYGMSFSRYENDGAGRYISSQTFQCTVRTFTAAGANLQSLVQNLVPRYAQHPNLTTNSDWSTTTCGAPLRSHYVQYESSSVDCDPEGGIAPCWRTNQRILSERTLFYDDHTTAAVPGVTIDHHLANGSSFDGLGHYRRTVTTSDGFKFDVVRTEKRNWNPSYSITNIPLATNPWMLEIYDQSSVEEGSGPGAVRNAAYDFNLVSGFLNGMRSYSNGYTPGANDVLTTYTRANQGTSVDIDTRTFGGDLQTISATSGTTPPATPEYWSRTTLRYGGLARRVLYCVDVNNPAACSFGQPLLVPENNVVDPNDGRVTTFGEPSGLTTAYGFDALGRLTSVTPTEGAGMTYTYTPSASMNNPAKVVMDQKKGGTTYAHAEYTYDPFGRLASEKHQYPPFNAANLSVKKWTYRATGEMLTESTVRKDGGPQSDKRFDNFDTFGRAKLMLPPDGGAAGKRVDYSFNGIQGMSETVYNISGSLSGASSAKSVTWKTSDALGRLRRVEESLLPNSPKTDYSYDATDQINIVTMDAQQRFFTHDGRGVMTKQIDPELNGVPVILTYDSRGHVRSKRINNSGSTPFDLMFTYDGAERLTAVAPRNQASNPLKEFFYYSDNSDCSAPGGYAAGKLRTAIRHNFVRDPAALQNRYDFLVQEHYRYLGVDGRVSSIRTTLGDAALPAAGPVRQFETAFNYDAQGNETSLVYPQCDSCGDNGTPRTLVQTFDLGYLTSINGFASAFTYFPNGLMEHFHHANGIEDWQDNDDAGIRRPKSISMRSSQTNILWKNGGGNYDYDGAGNIAAIGNDRYAYDSVGRLIDSKVGADGSGVGVMQSFQYDRWGNLGVGAMPTANGNNRLAEAQYDDGGNVQQIDGYTFEYDAFNQMTYTVGGGQSVGKIYLYTPSDERVGLWDFRYGAAPGRLRQLWSLRDASGHVLRDFETLDNAWHPLKDYVYRGGLLLATVQQDGTLRHYTLDHLGTPRIATDGSATTKAVHTYGPFGVELTATNDGERMKFTGHERDENNPNLGTQAGDLDYMHARYYQATRGRFLSIDPGKDSQPALPQSWNLYTYVHDDPLGNVDPSGMWAGDLVGRLQELNERFNQEIGRLEQAAAALRDVPIVRPSVRAGPSYKVNLGPVHAEVGVEFSGKANVATGKISVEARGQAVASLDGSSQRFGGGGKAAVVIVEHGKALPNGVRPQFDWVAQAAAGRANSSDVSVRLGTGAIGFELGFNYGKLGEATRETILAAQGILMKVTGQDAP
jgi:RHS repeat-associated protein